MGEGVKYYNTSGKYWSGMFEDILSGRVKLWAPIGHGFFFYNWDWTDAPYRRGSYVQCDNR
jgi:hypothetical protein